MAAAVEGDFSSWLSSKLQELNTDETVFASYIQGILDSDESSEEKSDALQGILSEIIEDEVEISSVRSEILEKWEMLKAKEPSPAGSGDVDLNAKFAKLLESQSLATTKQKEYTEEEKKIREAILSQYSQMTDSEGEDEACAAPPKPGAGEPKPNGLEKNLNAHNVAEAEKLKREHSRQEAQKKKLRDQEDREKQKQLKEEKKEKRKTQKGERRR